MFFKVVVYLKNNSIFKHKNKKEGEQGMKVHERLYEMYHQAREKEQRLYEDLKLSGENTKPRFTYRDDWSKAIGYRIGLYDAISYLTGFEGYFDFLAKLEGVEDGVQTGKED